MKRMFLWAAAGLILLVLAVPVLVVWSTGAKLPDILEKDSSVKIKMLAPGAKVVEMPLETYLDGVLAAEMPAEFSEEALKAQALAARTYAAKRMLTYGAGPNQAHPLAEICNNPAHCQAWISIDEMKARWGRVKYSYYLYKISRAVSATRGQVLTYEGKLIDPVYHGSCGGHGTESAGELWGQEAAYLQGVECRWEEANPKNRAEVKMPLCKVFDLIKELPGIGSLTVGKGNESIAVVSRTGTGRLKEVKVGGRQVSGRDFRSSLGLASTFVSWQVVGDQVIFKTEGKGHGVGLCQYGADGMAKAGKNYREILSHYYRGAAIKKL